MNRMYSKKVHILVFLFPALLLFCGVLIAPIGASAYFSFLTGTDSVQRRSSDFPTTRNCLPATPSAL